MAGLVVSKVDINVLDVKFKEDIEEEKKGRYKERASN